MENTKNKEIKDGGDSICGEWVSWDVSVGAAIIFHPTSQACCSFQTNKMNTDGHMRWKRA